MKQIETKRRIHRDILRPRLVYGGKLRECFMDCGAPCADLHVHVKRGDGGQERTIRWTVKTAAASDSRRSFDFFGVFRSTLLETG